MKLTNFSNPRVSKGRQFIDADVVKWFGLIRRKETLFNFGFDWFVLSTGERVTGSIQVVAHWDLLANEH